LGYLWEYGFSMLGAGLLSLVVWRREGFDVVHAHNPPDTFCLIAAAYKLAGKRFVFDHHDLAPEMYCARFGGGHAAVHRLLVWFERLSCRLADRVIVTNASYREIALRRGGVPAERITIVRNGPDLARLRPVEPDAELRAMGRTIIGFVGSMGHLDGLDLLLQALHHLKHELGRQDWYAVLVGSGDARSGLAAQAERLGLSDQVRFTGHLPDSEFLALLCAADICVDPDPSNPFNDRSTMIKMMEYMALGKPIVAFDLPEHRVTAGEAALYARPNDTADFARLVAALIDDPARRARLGRIGRARVERHWAWPEQVPALLSAYAALLGRPWPAVPADPGVADAGSSALDLGSSALDIGSG
jgi:glycosyltransferase involved in cell wall biosynthesis